MILSPAEKTLVEILRGKVGPIFALTITKIDETVVVAMALAGHGFSVGSGSAFETAFNSMAGVDPSPEDLPDEPLSLSHH